MNLFKEMNKFISKDKSRRRLQGIYHDSIKQYLVATSGKVLLAVPYPVKEEGIFFYKDKTWSKEFPYFNWTFAIPTNPDEVDLNVADLLCSIVKIYKEKELRNTTLIKFRENYYYPRDFYRGLKFLRETGSLPYTKMYYSPSLTLSPILFTDARIKYVFMPLSQDSLTPGKEIFDITPSDMV